MATATQAQFEAKYKEATTKLAAHASANVSVYADNSDIGLFKQATSWWWWPFYHAQPTKHLPWTHFRTGVNQTGDISSEWMDAAWGCTYAPIVLAIIGIVITICMGIRICSEVPPTWTKNGNKKKPGRIKLWRASLLSLFVLWFWAVLSISRGFYFLNTMDYELKRIRPDVYFIRDKLDNLQSRVQNAVIWLQDWQTSCIGYDIIKPHLSASLLKQNQGYIDMLANQSYKLYSADRKYHPIPKMFKKARKDWVHPVVQYQWLIMLAVLLPSLIPTAVICANLRITQNEDIDNDEEHVKRTINRLRTVGLVPLVISMLLMIIVTAAAMAGGSGLGLYCAHSEHNAVNLISAFVGNGNRTDNSTTLLASYYLTGKPETNPMVETLRGVRGKIQMVSDNLFILKPALDLLGLLCGRVGFARPADLVGEAMETVDRLLPLTKRDHLYSYFNDLSNKGVCGNLISSLGWWILSQAFAVLFALPYMTWRMHRHLLQHEAFLIYKEEEERKFVKEEEVRLLALETEKVRYVEMTRQQGGPSCSIS